MIPSDVVARLQHVADAAVTRIPSPQQVSEALAELVPGQRVLAEIQALLPNGAYRALVNQRDVTLALPFSAKAGDTLELEVVENEGRLTLAVVSRRGEGSQPPAGERPAVETTLSRTGNFIAGLLGRGEEGSGAKPAPLNANQPLAASPPTRAAELVPALRQAITQSGMFYESHQALWVGNRLPTAALVAEPQGQLSHPSVFQQIAPPRPHGGQEGLPPAPGAGDAAVANAPTKPEAGNSVALPDARPRPAMPAADAEPAERLAPSTTTPVESGRQPASALQPGQLVAPDLVPLVQQQLEALASQTYVWQGQAWPGQEMRWEIEEDGQRGDRGDTDAAAQWQTRLTLTMPLLGEVRASLRLVGGEVTLMLSADSDETAARLNENGQELDRQMQSAGLALTGFSVRQHAREEG